MRIDQLPRSENVEDRRGSGGFRIPGGRGGGIGILGVILLTLVAWWMGVDPSVLIGGADILTGGRQQEQPQQDQRPGVGHTRQHREGMERHLPEVRAAL